MQIESDLYNRQGKALTNFDLTLAKPASDLANETFKNPYNLDFLTLEEDVKELDLERALIQHIKKFLLELGRGFAYVGNQYNLNVDGDDFFLDLLFYNTHLHCYVVVELKVGDFKPEYAGKLNFYLTAVDEQIKMEADAPSIGILLCKTNNETIIKYSLKNIEKPMGVASYDFKKVLPKELKDGMPTKKELEEQLEVPENPVDQKLQKLKEVINKSSKKEKVVKRKKADVKKVIDKVFVKIIENIDAKIKDQLVQYFTEYNLHIVGNGRNSKSIEEFYENLELSDEFIARYRVRFQLEGFNKAGINAFHSDINFIFDFQAYDYTLWQDRKTENRVNMQRLYTQIVSKSEVEDVCSALFEQLVDDVSKKTEMYLGDSND